MSIRRGVGGYRSPNPNPKFKSYPSDLPPIPLTPWNDQCRRPLSLANLLAT